MNIRVADLAWIGLAMLHREHPDREGFRAVEIVAALKRHRLTAHISAGLHAHLYQHNVANTVPSSGRYRMFYRLPDGRLRLFRPGDDYHPARAGKTRPDPSEIPPRYRELVDWYETEYCSGAEITPENDPVLQMWGVGKELWTEGADAYVRREREAFEAEADRREAEARAAARPKRRAG